MNDYITGRTEEHLEEAKESITEFLRERGLSLSPEKTRIAHIDEGFDFLGWNFRKYDGKLLIKPAEKDVTNYVRKIQGIIKEMRTAKQEDLIIPNTTKIIYYTTMVRTVSCSDSSVIT